MVAKVRKQEGQALLERQAELQIQKITLENAHLKETAQNILSTTEDKRLVPNRSLYLSERLP